MPSDFLHDVIEYLKVLVQLLLEMLANDLPSAQASDSTPNNSVATESEEALIKAFHVFGSSLEEAKASPDQVRIHIKKSFRRLAVQHHPDRNDGSDESIAKMQEINHDYDLCCQKLDELEGIQEEPEPEEPSAGEQAEQRDEDVPNQPERPSGRRRRHRRRRRQRAAEDFDFEQELQRQREERQRQKAEILRELERLVGKRAAAQQPVTGNPKKSKKRKAARQPAAETALSSPEQIHKVWMEACRRVLQKTANQSEDSPSGASMHDIDIDDEHSASPSDQDDGGNRPSSRPVKPEHKTFLNCANELAVAIRLGHYEIVNELLHDRIDREIWERAVRSGYNLNAVPKSLVLEVNRAILLEPLDDDKNTLLHYVCYFEAHEVLTAVMMKSGPWFNELVLERNKRGQLPADFCCVANDATFKERIDSCTASAKQEKESKSLTNRIITVMKQLNVWQVLYSVSSHAVGCWLFGQGFWTSLLIVLYSNGIKTVMAVEAAGRLFLNHMTFRLVWSLYTWACSLFPGWKTRMLCYMCVFAFNVYVGGGLGSLLWRTLEMASLVSSYPVSWLETLVERTGLTALVKRVSGSRVPMRNFLMLVIYCLVGACLRFQCWPVLATRLVMSGMPGIDKLMVPVELPDSATDSYHEPRIEGEPDEL